MTSPIDTLEGILPWSKVMFPRTTSTSLIDAGGDPYINLPEGVSTVHVTWNGSTALTLYHRPNRDVRAVRVGLVPAASRDSSASTTLVLASTNGRGTLHFGTPAKPDEVEAGDVLAQVQVFPTPMYKS